jgi:hypothetical protein
MKTWPVAPLAPGHIHYMPPPKCKQATHVGDRSGPLRRVSEEYNLIQQ